MNPQDYNRILIEALNEVIEEYHQGVIQFFSERDLQAQLFSACLKIMRREGFTTPYKIYAEKGVIDKRKKTDLVLGNDEVLIELKLEPDYPGVSKPVVFSTIREAGGRGYGSVEEDMNKIDEYSKRGKHAHFIMIDEDGRHQRKIQSDWKDLIIKGRKRYWLHKYCSPKK